MLEDSLLVAVHPSGEIDGQDVEERRHGAREGSVAMNKYGYALEPD